MNLRFLYLGISIVLMGLPMHLFSQSKVAEKSFEQYDRYRETSLDRRRIKHEELLPLIEQLDRHPSFEVQRIGESIEGRSLSLISIGRGETDVFLWSQMHGNEPTATMALFDVLNWLKSPDFKEEKRALLAKLRLHFLPMLNPDGAEVYQRRNALGVDINRDALRLQSPESKVLKRVRDSLQAEFGFNLHDQRIYYNAERSENPATITFLAPPFNFEKDINATRADAMKVIVYLNRLIQKHIPAQVGKWSDDFEPRAFGDNMQKWGTSTILIESGGLLGDPEKQYIRKLNFLALLASFETLAKKSYTRMPLQEYRDIPQNDFKLFDLKITNLTYMLRGKPYILDLGIMREERDDEDHRYFHFEGLIAEQGDLSTYYGYKTFDATGYTAIAPKVTYNTTQADNGMLFLVNDEELLNKGVAYVRAEGISPENKFTKSPLHLVPREFELPEFKLSVGRNATFFLKKDGQLTHAVINGFLLELPEPDYSEFGNALIIH